MSRYEDFFSEEKIISIICRQRVALAIWRRDQEFFSKISTPGGKAIDRPDSELLLQSLFPPRKRWYRPPASIRASRSSSEILFISLYHTAIHAWKAYPQSGFDWLIKLKAFVANVRQRALSNAGQWIAGPIIVGRHKDGDYYRPIAQFKLIDSVLERITARYLRYCFDPDLLDCTMAFRIGRDQGPVPRHHDAIRRIVEYHNRLLHQPKWVAECDIKSFYDCVEHGIAREAINSAIVRAKSRSFEVDQRALRMLDAYLCAYSFSHNVKGNGLADLKEKRCNTNADFKWPEPALRLLLQKDPYQVPVGIPQGGALSCLLANLVLDSADRAVCNRKDDDLLYMRYCDDMILIHTDQEECRSGFYRYLETLDALRLPYHKPDENPAIYGYAFWNAKEPKTGHLEKRKTKPPYRWGLDDQPENVPWISFVGYQLHFLGHIRIRPDSLAKELKKQEKITDRVLFSIKQALNSGGSASGVKVSSGSVFARLERRLVSMAVGKRRINSDLSVLEKQCWAAGFELLGELPHRRNQLRMLDRGRGRQLNRVRRALSGLAAAMPRQRLSASHSQKSFLGRPFSYRGQFPLNLEID